MQVRHFIHGIVRQLPIDRVQHIKANHPLPVCITPPHRPEMVCPDLMRNQLPARMPGQQYFSDECFPGNFVALTPTHDCLLNNVVLSVVVIGTYKKTA
jgi:hypothetical protein